MAARGEGVAQAGRSIPAKSRARKLISGWRRRFTQDETGWFFAEMDFAKTQSEAAARNLGVDDVKERYFRARVIHANSVSRMVQRCRTIPGGSRLRPGTRAGERAANSNHKSSDMKVVVRAICPSCLIGRGEALGRLVRFQCVARGGARAIQPLIHREISIA